MLLLLLSQLLMLMLLPSQLLSRVLSEPTDPHRPAIGMCGDNGGNTIDVSKANNRVCYNISYHQCSKQAPYEQRLTTEPVRDFQVFVKAAESFSNIIITWKAPMTRITGEATFEIRITPVDYYSFSLGETKIRAPGDKAEQCILYHLYNIRDDQPNLQLQYVHDKIQQGNSYEVRVFSMKNEPKEGSPFTVPQSLIFIIPKFDGYLKANTRDLSAYWITDLVVVNDSCNHQVKVTFELAPRDFRFVEYEILLLTHNYNLINRTVIHPDLNQSHASFTFSQVIPGQYYATVMPIDTGKYDETRCLCRCNVTNEKLCDRVPCPFSGCETSVSGFQINIYKVPPADCEVLSPGAIYYVIAAFIGSTVAVIIFMVAAVGCFCCGKTPDTLNPYAYNQKRVLVVYSHDSQQHTDVVHYFNHFLERRCNVQIDVDYKNNRALADNWAAYIQQSIQRADKILLVISDGVRQVWRSVETSSSSVPEINMGNDPDNQLIVTYLRIIQAIGINSRHEILSKLIVARFEYTNAEPYIDERNVFNKPIRKLMTDINELVMDLHDVNRPPPLFENKPRHGLYRFTWCRPRWMFPVWYGKRYVNCSEGAKLEEAIKKKTNEALEPVDVTVNSNDASPASRPVTNSDTEPLVEPLSNNFKGPEDSISIDSSVDFDDYVASSNRDYDEYVR